MKKHSTTFLKALMIVPLALSASDPYQKLLAESSACSSTTTHIQEEPEELYTIEDIVPLPVEIELNVNSIELAGRLRSIIKTPTQDYWWYSRSFKNPALENSVKEKLSGQNLTTIRDTELLPALDQYNIRYRKDKVIKNELDLKTDVERKAYEELITHLNTTIKTAIAINGEITAAFKQQTTILTEPLTERYKIYKERGLTNVSKEEYKDYLEQHEKLFKINIPEIDKKHNSALDLLNKYVHDSLKRLDIFE